MFRWKKICNGARDEIYIIFPSFSSHPPSFGMDRNSSGEGENGAWFYFTSRERLYFTRQRHPAGKSEVDKWPHEGMYEFDDVFMLFLGSFNGMMCFWGDGNLVYFWLHSKLVLGKWLFFCIAVLAHRKRWLFSTLKWSNGSGSFIIVANVRGNFSTWRNNLHFLLKRAVYSSWAINSLLCICLFHSKLCSCHSFSNFNIGIGYLISKLYLGTFFLVDYFRFSWTLWKVFFGKNNPRRK